jgi:P-type Ca2+ transporter type 2C
MIYFMVFAAILSFAVAKTTTAYAILWVIFAIVLVWFLQEFKAENAVNALKNMLESFSTVIRDGKEKQISSKELVPGDIVLLETWEKIPADCLVLEAKDLMLNEAILTWESKEISKVSVDNSKLDNNADSLVFMWTYIVNGRVVVQVIKTWMHTEFGKIASMISAAEKELPLQKKVNRLVKFMATIAVVVSVLAGIIMFLNLEAWTTEHIVEILLISIALMISAFPEWLPVVLISTLAWWAYKMAKKKAIVNRMSIIETLWETTVICSDKTWTITKWEMTVKEIITFENDFEVTGIWYETKWDFILDNQKIQISNYPVLNQLLESSILCNNAHILNQETGRKFKWTPTEIALMVMWHKASLVEDIVHFQRLEELPFNSARKMMSVLVEKEWKKIVYSKWAPEMFLPHCTHIQTKDEIKKIWKEELQTINNKIDELTKKKYRVLCIGYKILEKNNIGELEEKIILLWCVWLQDSPREWVLWAVQSCYNAGIKVKMITWDNKDTAVAIANDVWIFGRAVTGDELDDMTDEDLKSIIQDIWVFARVKPEHKIRIVKTLKEQWEIVTMTWDGVNDAPALKEAHIWVAMWINWTDVSREAADLILEDDNFVTIVAAVEEW